MEKPPEHRFAQFFAETRQGLLRYVRRLVGSRETAEDIVQEAYARTYAQGGSVETPRAFLFTAARNLAFNANRDRRIASTELQADLDAVDALQAPGASPEDGLIADEATRLLREAIERLPPQCRAAFVLKVFQGCSYKEIAAQLAISPKTVEKHISRGLQDTHAYMRRRYRDMDAGKDVRNDAHTDMHMDGGRTRT